ncbi:CTP-dependent diacylglycerol kinase 1 [Hypsizygus marmoreus]|uniref:CTP-dependent diacylglycerol kinase 1 n=1 Tax=Hypsizygus marmoreus TaxID=39966 RepID=A0A369KGZ7_HYPMA|nr:CTP-dependent diacylglycerol kinase 1 [Hypsizygus marmoreus]
MTARDPVLVDAHEPQPAPRRRRSLSTASARSLSSKRSPSPIITFTAAPLSPDVKGVKNITRKVIKTLEGLGHLDSSDMDEQEEDYETDEKLDLSEVEAVLNGTAHFTSGSSPENFKSRRSNGTAIKAAVSSPSDAVGTSREVEQKKIDWEIPRKLLHSSIGFFTVYLYVSEGNVKNVVLVLWTALAVIVPADFLRLRYPRFERIYERCLGFLMRESEKKTSNGVIWYILGVNFALTVYPLDVATVAILILSWADTAASTFGRLLGSKTSRLPARMPVLRLPLAPRKSVAGFIAASITGALIAAGFWTWIAPFRSASTDVSWWWDGGVRASSSLLGSLGIDGPGLGGAGGWVGLCAISLMAGLVSGVAEALDLGSLDDNLTLPIIAGGCILGFFKLLGLFSS